MTETATHGVDADFRRTLTVNAGPDALRAAVTTEDGVSGWWMPTVSREPHVLTVSFGDRTAAFRVTASPDLVVWDVLSCAVEPAWVGTTIEFAMTEDSAETVELVFTHRGLGALPCAETCFAGWTHFLPSLVSYVESGVGNPGRRQS